MNQDKDLGIWVANNTENYWEKGDKFHLIRYWSHNNNNWVRVINLKTGKKLPEVYITLIHTYFTPLDEMRQNKINQIIE
jgi:hypothetical protein